MHRRCAQVSGPSGSIIELSYRPMPCVIASNNRNGPEFVSASFDYRQLKRQIPANRNGYGAALRRDA